VVASNAIVRELDSRSGQTKDYEIWSLLLYRYVRSIKN
jgi:hypothetical protein